MMLISTFSWLLLCSEPCFSIVLMCCAAWPQKWRWESRTWSLLLPWREAKSRRRKRSVVVVVVSCGCYGLLWSVVVVVNCGCCGQLWLLWSVVVVVVSCGCYGQLLWSVVVVVVSCCGQFLCSCGQFLWLLRSVVVVVVVSCGCCGQLLLLVSCFKQGFSFGLTCIIKIMWIFHFILMMNVCWCGSFSWRLSTNFQILCWR